MEKDYSGKIRQLKNLAMFKNQTDEEIEAYLRKRDELKRNAPEEEPEKPVATKGRKKDEAEEDAQYDQVYAEKLESLQKEYGIDMNNSNDAEMLRILADHAIQKDVVKRQIQRLQREPDLDTRTLKNLGDYQKGLISTMTELQEKLGIQRKQRKEKQVDSIPQFVDLVRKRARSVWERETVAVRCEACEIELARYWLNFPDKVSVAHFEIECWKCGELVVYYK